MKIIPTIQAAELGDNLIKSPSWFSGGAIKWDNLVNRITGMMFFVAAIAALFYLIWGGIGIITSGGDKGKLDEGRRRVMFAAIGIIVVASSYAIWALIMNIAGIGSLDPGI